MCFVLLLPRFFPSFLTLSCHFSGVAAMSRQTRFCPTRRGSLISPLCLALLLVWLTPCRVLACRPPAAGGTHPPTCNDWILLFHYGLLPPVQVSPLMISLSFQHPHTMQGHFTQYLHDELHVILSYCVMHAASWSPADDALLLAVSHLRNSCRNDCSVLSVGFWIASNIVELHCL